MPNRDQPLSFALICTSKLEAWQKVEFALVLQFTKHVVNIWPLGTIQLLSLDYTM